MDESLLVDTSFAWDTANAGMLLKDLRASVFTQVGCSSREGSVFAHVYARLTWFFDKLDCQLERFMGNVVAWDVTWSFCAPDRWVGMLKGNEVTISLQHLAPLHNNVVIHDLSVVVDEFVENYVSPQMVAALRVYQFLRPVLYDLVVGEYDVLTSVLVENHWVFVERVFTVMDVLLNGDVSDVSAKLFTDQLRHFSADYSFDPTQVLNAVRVAST